MRFFIHHSCHLQTAASLKGHGHEANLHAQSGLSLNAAPDAVLEHCRKQQLELLTRDREHAEAAGGFNRVLVLLNLGDNPGDVEQDDALDRLLKRFKRLSPGQCYTVTPNQVKVKQLPRT
ncbi:MAG: DUF5615 family PIN-like protein [Phycisphaerae bacterium]